MWLVADLELWPGGLISWILVGLISGWLAGLAMKGSGYGILGDIAVGLLGAVVGGFVFSFLVQGYVGFFGSIIVSFLGACLMIGILRLLFPRAAGV